MSILISGPISLTIARYGDLKFILFGDRHNSNEGECTEIKCSNATNFTDDDLCYTADGIIAKIIKDAEKENQYVDIYLESRYNSPFISESTQESTSPLDITIKQFHSCMYEKEKCHYKNARFHYIDIREIREKYQYIGLDFVELVMNNAKSVPNAIEMFLSLYDNIFIKKLHDNQDGPDIHILFIEIGIMINVFFNESNFVNSNLFKYYKLAFESDDFINDVDTLLFEILIIDPSYIEYNTNLLIIRYSGHSEIIQDEMNKIVNNIQKHIRSILIQPSLITTRYGKTMHKIRAQLLGLELQGDKDRADSIINFIYNEMTNIKIGNIHNLFSVIGQSRINYIQTGNSRDIVKVIPKTGHLTILGSIIVDIYTLTRMFRTYPTEYQSKDKLTKNHIPSNYIIEYAGNSHIDTIKKYLTQQGAIINIYPTTNKRCISVPKDAFN